MPKFKLGRLRTDEDCIWALKQSGLKVRRFAYECDLYKIANPKTGNWLSMDFAVLEEDAVIETTKQLCQNFEKYWWTTIGQNIE